MDAKNFQEKLLKYQLFTIQESAKLLGTQNEFTESVVNFVSKELRRTVVKAFEVLSDDELAVWEQSIDILLSPVGRKMTEKISPLMFEFGLRIGAGPESV